MANCDMKETTFVDITEYFMQAASQLAVGEMIHSQDFSLQRTLTAVLVGDPFFDKTYAFKNPNWIPCERLNDDDDTLLMDLMCTVISQFTSWLDGKSFVHTVYSCDCLRHLQSLTNRKWRNFLLLVVKACQSVDQCIIDAQVVEEEDFVLCRPLLESILWSEVETDYLSAQQFVESHWNESNKLWNKPLQFFYYFCQILDCILNKPPSRKESLQDIICATKHTLNAISFESPSVQVSHHENVLQSAAPYDTFSATQKRLCDLLSELEECLNFIPKCVVQVETCNHLFPFLWNIFYFNRTKRHILTRSILYLKLCTNSRRHRYDSFTKETTWSSSMWLRNMGWKVWQSHVKEWELDSISKVNYIVHRLDYLIQDIFHVVCLNRGKQRRRLLNLLSLVESLYMQSIGNKEETATTNPLSLFIQELGFMISIQHLLLGFDCDLYDSSEFSAVYFVLGQLYECWSNIVMRYSSSIFSWQNHQPQQQQLWNKWIVVSSKMYRASCLLWEQQQQCCTREQSDEIFRVSPLAYEIRFFTLANYRFIPGHRIAYSLFHEEIVEPIAQSFSSMENIRKYWLEPLVGLFESIKKMLEYIVKEENSFYFMDSKKEWLRWSIHHLVYLTKTKSIEEIQSWKMEIIKLPGHSTLPPHFYLPQLNKESNFI